MHDRIDELTQALSLGCAEALTSFYREWFDWMYAAARAFTNRDEAFCLDVVQDAMLRVIKSIKRMDTRADLERWLSTVVRRAAIDRLRRESRHSARDRAAGTQCDDLPSMRVSAEEHDWLRAALSALAAEDRELITARHRFGWTLARIGADRAQTPGAVHGRIVRVLSLLRRHARESFDAP